MREVGRVRVLGVCDAPEESEGRGVSDRVELPSAGGPGGERCGRCRYFVDGDDSHCRRYPPVPSDLWRLAHLLNARDRWRAEYGTHDDDLEIYHRIMPGVYTMRAVSGIYPTTDEDDFCGEFRPRAGAVDG